MRNRKSNLKKEQIRDSINSLVIAATQLSLAIQSDSNESTDDSVEREQSIVSHPPPVQISQNEIALVQSSSTVPVKTSRRATRRQQSSVPQRPGPYKIGEQLIITNNYLNARGTEGVVLSSKGAYTVIQDDTGILHTRAHSNYNRVINP